MIRLWLARFTSWLQRIARGRCTSHFTTAFDEELRCELPYGHRVAHHAHVTTNLARTYRYEWAYGPRWTSERR